MIDRKVIGGILLIGGTAIGAGMLALPVALAKAGFVPGIILLLLSWCYMTHTAFLLLEANLYLPRYCNIISMTQNTLGAYPALLAWGVYLLLLYTLLSAYTAGGSDLIHNIFQLLHFKLSRPLCALIFIGLLGGVVAKGISAVDQTNRVLMIVKISLYAILFFSIVPHVKFTYWLEAQPLALLPVIPVVIAAFGFSIIVPTLRAYLHDDVQKLRITIFVGSLLPLIIYVLWIGAILGTVVREGDKGLIQIFGTPHEVTLLVERLQASLNNRFIGDLFRTFSTVSLLTAFLAVSLSLTDFLADGFNLTKRGFGLIGILLFAFVPPLAVVGLNPALFVKGFNYAGICVVVLMCLAPALMVWVARYHQKQKGYRVKGGKIVLGISITISVILLINALYSAFFIPT